MNQLRRFFRGFFQVLRMAGTEFYADDGFNLAAGLSFFAILSIIPIVLIIISILGHYLNQSEPLFAQLSDWVMATLPQVQPDFIEFLRQLVDRKLTAGWIGILFLIFVASILFANIEHILHIVLKSSRRRNFWHSRALSIALILISAIVFFALITFNVLYQYLSSHESLFQMDRLVQANSTYFAAHFLAFVLLVRFAPNESVRMRNILLGGLLFGLLILVAKNFFRWYMGLALERYHFIYGSLTVLVLLILWIYYLSVIFVFCGEVVNGLQKLFPQEAPS